jgi:thiosulfate/3-mercaptopyruvate sulfurtransferase
VNVALPDLPTTLEPHRNRGAIVLYSNGMTHPAQARDALARLGFGNVYLLTDGLQGFRERVLKPVSLRSEPLPPAAAARVQAWRAYFAAPDAARTAEPSAGPSAAPSAVPRLAATVWLQERLGTPGLKVVDLRPQPDYNTSHIPGSLSLQVDSLRGNVGGVPSMLLPATLLAAQFSLLGLTPSDTVVLVGGEKFQDATLPAMAFERVGHTRYAALDGGFAKWAAEGRPVDAALPVVRASDYPVPPEADRFTADADDVRAAMERPGAVILDVRPADFYAGKKSDEARAGHIPGALNRPFSDDVSVGTNKVATLRSVAELAAAYSKLIPSQDSEVIVHCRTGHQASQTFFVLKHVLGYRNVRWYDGGWTEWAARPDLPVATDGPAPSGR